MVTFVCLLPQEELEEMPATIRLRRVEPFWESLSHEERVEIMTFSVKEVKAEALLCAKQIEQEADGTATFPCSHLPATRLDGLEAIPLVLYVEHCLTDMPGACMHHIQEIGITSLTLHSNFFPRFEDSLVPIVHVL